MEEELRGYEKKGFNLNETVHYHIYIYIVNPKNLNSITNLNIVYTKKFKNIYNVYFSVHLFKTFNKFN